MLVSHDFQIYLVSNTTKKPLRKENSFIVTKKHVLLAYNVNFERTFESIQVYVFVNIIIIYLCVIAYFKKIYTVFSPGNKIVKHGDTRRERH